MAKYLDETGLKHLKTKIKEMIPESSTPDWNQNDETAAGYIQNKPFYEKIVTNDVTVLEKNSYDITLTDDELNFYNYYFSEEEQARINSLKDGKAKIKFTMNDVYRETDEFTIENGEWIAEDSSMFAFTDTGLALRIVISKTDIFFVTPSGFDPYGDSNPPLELELIISNTAQEVVKIDKKFLSEPDWNQNDETAAGYIQNRPFYEEVTTTEDIVLTEAERNCKDNGGDVGDWTYEFTEDEHNTLMSVLEGKTEVDFVLSIDGSDYVNSYHYDGSEWRSTGDWTLDGNVVRTLGLYIYSDEASFGAIPAACNIDSGNHTVSLKCIGENATITTIPEKFLPENIATKEDIAQAIGTALEGSY